MATPGFVCLHLLRTFELISLLFSSFFFPSPSQFTTALKLIAGAQEGLPVERSSIEQVDVLNLLPNFGPGASASVATLTRLLKLGTDVSKQAYLSIQKGKKDCFLPCSMTPRVLWRWRADFGCGQCGVHGERAVGVPHGALCTLLHII